MWTLTGSRWGAGFSSVARFVAEIEAAAAGTGKLRAGYVLAGDEIFLLDRCRAAVLKAFVPSDLRDFCLSDLDLSSTSIFEVLDRAQTPSLMSPFQVIFIRNVRQLYTRGAKKEEFAALDRYFQSPNPQALLLVIAQIEATHIPHDTRRMELDDKNRFERLTETLGQHCGIVELARVSDEDAMRWAVTKAEEAGLRLEPDAARELVDALGADMMLVSSELEKLQGALHLGPRPHHSWAMWRRWCSARQTTRTLCWHLDIDAISARDRVRALALPSALQGLLNSSDAGEDSAIGHLYMLARTFRQMLVILEKNVRDSRAIWQALWQGFRRHRRSPPTTLFVRRAATKAAASSRASLRPQVARADVGIALLAAGQAPGEARAPRLRACFLNRGRRLRYGPRAQLSSSS